jgi:tRNA-dihydrouridine synthase
MEIAPDEQPISIQLFDCRPDFMAQAACKAVREGAKTIDMGATLIGIRGIIEV